MTVELVLKVIHVQKQGWFRRSDNILAGNDLVLAKISIKIFSFDKNLMKYVRWFHTQKKIKVASK